MKSSKKITPKKEPKNSARKKAKEYLKKNRAPLEVWKLLIRELVNDQNINLYNDITAEQIIQEKRKL